MSGSSQVLLTWYQEVWTEKKWSKVDETFQPAPPEECLIPDGAADLAETKEFINVVDALIDDRHLRVIHIMEDGDWVSAVVEMTGKQALTGKPVDLHWQTTVRISDGRIVESYPSVNFLSFFEQLGQLPENCVELLLGGTTLK